MNGSSVLVAQRRDTEYSHFSEAPCAHELNASSVFPQQKPLLPPIYVYPEFGRLRGKREKSEFVINFKIKKKTQVYDKVLSYCVDF